MLLRLFFLGLIFTSVCAFALDPAPESFPNEIEALRNTPDLRSFVADDGTKLSFGIFDKNIKGQHLGPIVISTGKGESVYRYLEFAKEMQARGYGPIYVLEHRGQGFSNALGRNFVHVEDFHSYVKDFIKFMDGPVKADLLARKITEKPKVVAHSMGGTVVKLARLLRPDLAERFAYIAPMDEIKLGSFMEYFHNKPAKWATGFLRLLGMGEHPFGNTGNAWLENPASSVAGRLRSSYLIEQEKNIRTPGQSFAWANEAIKADGEILDSSPASEDAAIIFQGQVDERVNNSALYNYACKHKQCTLVEISDASHAIHQEENGRRFTLEDLIDKYFQGQPLLEPRCADLYRIIFRPREAAIPMRSPAPRILYANGHPI